MKNFYVKFVLWLAAKIERYRVSRLAIDVNAKCPACGHCSGEIVVAGTQDAAGKIATSIEHRCKICKAKFYEPTIVLGEKWLRHALPASAAARVPRQQKTAPIKKISPIAPD